ncbi:MAG: hypothetical protein DPW16_15490 [Chloroflexi bacterium]|nr:hypothetical protein [Chloroflexota bacterium]
MKRLTVRGKGNKERLVPITGGSLQALLDWLVVRGNGSGPLFFAVNEPAESSSKPSRGRRFSRFAASGRQKPKSPISPHDFRRTIVGDLLDVGAVL